MPLSTPESALQAAVDAIGTMQQVGCRLRPELERRPDEAGRWLASCLDPERKHKLSYAQQVLVFRWAAEAGDHTGFRLLAELAGYRAEPFDPQAEIKALLKRSEQASERAAALSQEALARMAAAGIKTEELDA
jgi:hypothetical protein